MPFNFFEVPAKSVGADQSCAGCPPARPTAILANDLTARSYRTIISGQPSMDCQTVAQILSRQFPGIEILPIPLDTSKSLLREQCCAYLEFKRGTAISPEIINQMRGHYLLVFVCSPSDLQHSAFWHTAHLLTKIVTAQPLSPSTAATPLHRSRAKSVSTSIANVFLRRTATTAASEAAAATVATGEIRADQDIIMFFFNPAAPIVRAAAQLPPPSATAVENLYEPLERLLPPVGSRDLRRATAPAVSSTYPRNPYSNSAAALRRVAPAPLPVMEESNELLDFIEINSSNTWSNQNNWLTILERLPAEIASKFNSLNTTPPVLFKSVKSISTGYVTLDGSIGEGIGILSINNPSNAGAINKTIFPKAPSHYTTDDNPDALLPKEFRLSDEPLSYYRGYYFDVVIAVDLRGGLICVPTEEFFTHLAANNTVPLPPLDSLAARDTTVTLPYYSRTRVSYLDTAPSLYSKVMRIFQAIPSDKRSRSPSPLVFSRPSSPSFSPIPDESPPPSPRVPREKLDGLFGDEDTPL